MDTGGVENPGAVNSRDDDASATSEQELMDTPIEDNGINFDVVSDSAEATNEEKEYNFSSKDIPKREKIDFFTNVEGAEKIKKQEERRHEAEERKRLKALKKLKPEKNQKRQRAEGQNDGSEKRIIRGQKVKARSSAFSAFIGRIISFFFKEKRGWFTIGTILMLVGITVTLIIYTPIKQKTDNFVTDYVDYWDTDIMRNPYYIAVTENMDMLRESGKENEAIEYIEKIISDNNGHQANLCSLLTIYERFLISGYKYDKALVKAEEAERLAITSVQKDNLYNDLLHIWTMLGNDEKVGEYEGKIEENRRDVEAEEKKAFEGREHEEE